MFKKKYIFKCMYNVVYKYILHIYVDISTYNHSGAITEYNYSWCTTAHFKSISESTRTMLVWQLSINDKYMAYKTFPHQYTSEPIYDIWFIFPQCGKLDTKRFFKRPSTKGHAGTQSRQLGHSGNARKIFWSSMLSMERFTNWKGKMIEEMPIYWGIFFKKSLRVPTVMQRKQIWLGTMGFRVPSLASLRGLRIRCCHELQCGSGCG